MIACVRFRNVIQRLLKSLIVLTALFSVGMELENPMELQAESPSVKTQSNTPRAGKPDVNSANILTESSAMRVYRNPNTGKIEPPPPKTFSAKKPPRLSEALSTSSEGLVETPSPIPGGGITVDLKGRFRSPLTATRDANGKITIHHSSNVTRSTK